jgi:hypothetical protein
MHNKERRKLEILLELRKYLSPDIIVKDIEDDISPSTEIMLRKDNEDIKILIGVTKNIIHLEPACFIDSLDKVSYICPKFKTIKKEQFNSAKTFINNYINYFSNEVEFDIGDTLQTMTTYQKIDILKNSFYTSLELSHEILLTERVVTYMVHISLNNHKGFRQEFIVSSTGNGIIHLAVGVESHYVQEPIHNLKEKDYMKYFLFCNDFLFEKQETIVTVSSKFEDVKRTLELMDMMSI